jgi:hypothetical protein
VVKQFFSNGMAVEMLKEGICHFEKE